MPLASCVRCNRMFNKVDYPVCPSCMPQEDADLARIRDVLAEHANVNVDDHDEDRIWAVLAEHNDLSAEDVAARADVDLAVVHRMVDRGVVVRVTNAERATCGRCGAPAISLSKKLCKACLAKLNVEMNRAQASIKLDKVKPAEIGQLRSVRKTFDDKRK